MVALRAAPRAGRKPASWRLRLPHDSAVVEDAADQIAYSVHSATGDVNNGAHRAGDDIHAHLCRAADQAAQRANNRAHRVGDAGYDATQAGDDLVAVQRQSGASGDNPSTYRAKCGKDACQPPADRSAEPSGCRRGGGGQRGHVRAENTANGCQAPAYRRCCRPGCSGQRSAAGQHVLPHGCGRASHRVGDRGCCGCDCLPRSAAGGGCADPRHRAAGNRPERHLDHQRGSNVSREAGDDVHDGIGKIASVFDAALERIVERISERVLHRAPRLGHRSVDRFLQVGHGRFDFRCAARRYFRSHLHLQHSSIERIGRHCPGLVHRAEKPLFRGGFFISRFRQIIESGAGRLELSGRQPKRRGDRSGSVRALQFVALYFLHEQRVFGRGVRQARFGQIRDYRYFRLDSLQRS